MEVQVGYKKIRKNGGRKSCVSVLNTLRGQKHRNFFKLRLWGFRLGPTDVTHPLLTSVCCPFNFLQSFTVKRAPIEVKQISSYCQRLSCVVQCVCMSETHGNIIFHYRTNF